MKFLLGFVAASIFWILALFVLSAASAKDDSCILFVTELEEFFYIHDCFNIIEETINFKNEEQIQKGIHDYSTDICQLESCQEA